jgi:hypothetical protein
MMDAGKGTDSTKSEKPIIVPDDEDDEAASVVAGLSKCPTLLNDGSTQH